jgi:DNA-directed DNA polymerase III PolC
MSYFNLHSHFSLMGGLSSPEQLCTSIKAIGETHIALTDTNGLYGIPEFLEASKQAGLVGIIGTEIRHYDFSFIVLVKNHNGYKGLCEYLSFFHQFKSEVSILKSVEILAPFKDDLIFISFRKNIIKAFDHANFKNLYFELTRGFFNKNDILWAESLGVECIANNKVHYIDKNDYHSYQLIRAIDENTTLGEVDTSAYHNAHCYLKDTAEIQSYFAIYPQAIANARKLLLDLDSSWFYQGDISPGHNGFTETACDLKLKDLCLERISNRYDTSDTKMLAKVHARLDYEMDIIGKKNFSSYFLNVVDIASQCEYTCGRGSSAASIVNYLLEITHVDPIAENLLFDRFMNMDRMDPPDIDVDFPSDQRDDVMDYVFDKYKGRAAMVANQNYLRGKSALREVAKVFGVKEDEISYTIDRLHTLNLNRTWEKIVYHACKIEGVVRHLSVHCGGVIITPGRIDHYVPVETSKKGYPVIQWEKDQTELAGLIKTDLLGNKGLSVIRDVINTVNHNCDEDKAIDYKNLDAQNDLLAQEVFIKGHTVGVVHFESPRCKTLLAAFKDYSLLTLSIVCSIIRPAAMVQVSEMLRRFHGGKFRYAHPELEEILGITKGIMVYQEDVMRVTKALAGFTSQEGNELRKVLAKKSKEKRLKVYKEKFFVGCTHKGIAPEDIDLLWADIQSFAGYSFCKPHSDSYSLVAYKSAYLKAHHPAEFMAAVISNGGGFYIGNVEDYLNEARRMGVAILPPDVNLSGYEYRGSNFEIRVGLKQIKHINKKLIQKIIGERELKEFASIADFLNRVNPGFNDARILVKARCFNSMRSVDGEKLTHTKMMWMVYEHFAKEKGQLAPDKSLPVLSKKLPEFDKEKLIYWEQEFLNGFVTFPSWFLYRDILKDRQIIAGSGIDKYLGQEIILYGQKVSQKRVSTKYKEHMAFITFADDTCMFNTTFFPAVYEECRDLIFLGGSYLIKGKVEKDLQDYQIVVSDLQRIGEI